MNPYLLLAMGVGLAGLGGDLFLRGLVGSARWLRVSPAIMGATVAAFATSSPELAVAIISATSHHPGISLGNVLGANVVNLAVVLGLALLIAPIPSRREEVGRDFTGALLVPAVLGLLAFDGRLSRLDGIILLALFGGWLATVVRDARRERKHADPIPSVRPVPFVLAAGVGGLAALFAGGRLIVSGATAIALQFGVPDFVIGATVVAVGTTVPELATTLIAQLRGHHQIGLGTVLGSNIFNSLFIVGLAATLSPIPTAGRPIPISLAAGFLAAALVFPGRTGFLTRRRGALLLTLYAAYLTIILQN